MMSTGLVGSPVAHSLSPLMHNEWFRQSGIEGLYTAHDVPANGLSGFVRMLAEDGYRGVNVTIPYKQVVMPLCDSVDGTARAIGAVNAIVVKDGTLHGTNTDWTGFIDSLRKDAPGLDFTAGPALVLGAGGGARAIIYGLKQAGVPEIIVSNRTPEKLEALRRDFKVTTIEWARKEDAAKSCGLIVNTTAAGMKGRPPLDFDVVGLKDGTVVCDIVYNPLMTPLLTAAKERGLKTVDGLGMLIYQAQAAFTLWTGTRPEIMPALRQNLEGVLS